MSMANDPFRVQEAYGDVLPYANGSAGHGDDGMREEQGRMIETGWKEPPLRTPQPSFMDYKGLERVGVLQNMQALGTRPTKRMRDSARSDSLRKSRLARGFGAAAGIDSARATPDQGNMSESTRGASARPEEQSPQSTPMSESFFNQLPEAVQAQDSPMMDYPAYAEADEGARQQQQQAPYSPPGPPIDPSLFEPGEVTTPQPPAPIHPDALHSLPIATSAIDKIENAIVLSNNRRPDLHAMITHLHSAILKDSELGALLAVNAEGGATDFSKRHLRRKIGKVKRSVRIPDFSPARSRSSKGVGTTPAQITFVTSASSTTDPNLSALPPLPPPPPPPPAPVMPNPSHPPSKQTTPHKKIKLITGLPSIGSPLKNISKSPAHRSRRASSSPLSSVDEQIAQQIDPAASEMANPRRKRARSPDLDVVEQVESKKRHCFELHENLSRSAKRSAMRSSLGTANNDLTTPPPLDEAVIERPSTRKIRITMEKPGKLGLANTRKRSAEVLDDSSTAPTALGRPPKRRQQATKLKLSVSAQPQKGVSNTATAGGRLLRGRESASVPEPDPEPSTPNSEQSAHNDSCDICGGQGMLVCCDGCPRALHSTCLTPPRDPDDLPEIFFCPHCEAPPPQDADLDAVPRERGLWSSLFDVLDTPEYASKNFEQMLPAYVRDFFEGVKTGEDGQFVEVPTGKPKTNRTNRFGVEERTNTLATFDRKGSIIMCYKCNESTDGKRHLVPCDYCDHAWHIDCLSPPLANPPNAGTGVRKPWMCPLHVEHDLRALDPLEGTGGGNVRRSVLHKIRKPRNPEYEDTYLRRGHKNNGLIEILDESSDEDEDAFYSGDEVDSRIGKIPRIPAESIKLDFIAKIKANREYEDRARYTQALQRRSDWEDEQQRIQQLERKRAQVELDKARRENELLRRREFHEGQAALNLIQFARGHNDARFANDSVSNLIMTLQAEAAPTMLSEPASSSDFISSDAPAKNSKQRAESASISEQLDQLETLRKLIEQREHFLKAQIEG